MTVQAQGFASVFSAWPKGLPRKGVAVTMQAEHIVFTDFSLGHGCVLLVRATPDSTGGRLVIVPFEQLATVKFTEVPSDQLIRELGFQGPSAKTT